MSSNELEDYHIQHIQAYISRSEQVRSWFIIRMKGLKEGFVPVLASLGIQSKSFISTSGRSGKKKRCFWDAVCQPNFLWLIIVLALLFKALLFVWIKFRTLQWVSLPKPVTSQTSQDVSTLRTWSLVLVKQYYFIVREHGCANSSSCKPHGPQLCQ